jgi:hypothetical protein
MSQRDVDALKQKIAELERESVWSDLIHTKTFFMIGANFVLLTAFVAAAVIFPIFRIENPFSGTAGYMLLAFIGIWGFGFLCMVAMLLQRKFRLRAEVSKAKAKLDGALQ